MVIVDTSAWIPFFNRPDSDEKRAIDARIDSDRSALVGVVLAELLQGCHTAGESRAILSEFSGLPFLEATFATWRQTGELAASLRRKGITVPLSDVLIAALALEHRCQVFTFDPHFQRIPGLALYRPARRIRP